MAQGGYAIPAVSWGKYTPPVGGVNWGSVLDTLTSRGDRSWDWYVEMLINHFLYNPIDTGRWHEGHVAASLGHVDAVMRPKRVQRVLMVDEDWPG
jgi:hypothetical protein